jgi:hypothetical protein
VFNFYWIHLRRGKLVISPPIKFGLHCARGQRKLVIGLPLVFYNGGATTMIVNNLRVRIDGHGTSFYLHFNDTRKDVDSGQRDQWGYTFTVEARKAIENVFVFMNNDIDYELPTAAVEYSLEAQLNQSTKWKEVIQKGKLLTPEKHHKSMQEIYRVYDNC